MKREFECNDGPSSKFWNIELTGEEYSIQFGKTGTKGQTRSKSFDTEELASKEFDKQIAAKLKKGYEEVAASDQSISSDSPKKIAKKNSQEKQSVSTKKVEDTDSEMPIFSSKVIRTIDLEPWEKCIAPWEDPYILDKPEPKPFDRDDCIERLKIASLGTRPTWRHAEIASVVTWEEARFWLYALFLEKDRNLTKSQKLKQLEGAIFEGDLDLQEVLSWLASFGSNQGFFPCLVAVFPIEEIVVHRYKGRGYCSIDRAAGFKRFVLPFLNLEEKKALIDDIRGRLNFLVDDSMAIAASLGMYTEVRKVVDPLQDAQSSGELYFDHNLPWILFGLESAEAVVSEFRRIGLGLHSYIQGIGFLATTGHSGLDILLSSVAAKDSKDDAQELARVLDRVHSPEAAEIALRLIVETKAQEVGIEWLMGHPLAAAVALPELAMAKGKLADAARDHLLVLHASDNRNAIEAALPNLDDLTAAWVKTHIIENETSKLESVPMDSLPTELQEKFSQVKTNRKFPDWVLPPVLPPIRIAAGKLGGAEIEKVLCDIKAFGVLGESALCVELKKHAEATSLDAFAWKICESWLNIGAPAKEKWAMGAVGHLGGDNCVFNLTPLVREWPGQSQHQRAVAGLDCLRKIGTDTALMALNGIAQKLKYKGLKEKAQIRMQEIAESKGMTSEQLADRIVPDCGLDEKGSRVFDFGPRKFEFVFTPDFKPAVRDEAGKVRANLPKPNKSDDADISQIALNEWKLLKKTLREALKVQNSRMEEAMITGRSWSPVDFQSYLMQHPLMVHLVRSIIWGVYDEQSGDLKSSFRVTEDHSLADSEDEECVFPEEQIGVVHPAHLKETDKSNWGEVLSDYEIIPPFQQLGRSIYTAENDDLKKTEITRFKDTKIPGISLYGILERSHWVKDTPADGGGFMQHSKYFPSVDITAFIQYDPGLSIGWYDEEQRISSVYFVPGHIKPDWWGNHKNKLMLLEVDAVVVSEVLRMVHVLVSKGE